MRRRAFVATTGTALLGSIAGCSDPEASSGDKPADESSSGGNTDQNTETDTSTAAATETPQPVHDVGDAFTVGSGEKTVEYVVHSADGYSNLGGEYGEDASGVFAVVDLEMTNQTDETVDVSSNIFKLVDSDGNEFDADAGASVYVEMDDRVESEGIAFEQLNPNLSTRGAVVWDVNPGVSYELLIEPVGVFSAADPQRVALGEITAP